MSTKIRAATSSDVPQMVELLMQDTQQRQALNPTLWAITEGADEQVEKAVRSVLEVEKGPFRQKWIVANGDDGLMGIVHSMLLPVPPIYAGKWGEPGLLLPDSVVSKTASSGTVEALVEAAEADLQNSGAQLLLASYVTDDDWRRCYSDRGYEPLTLYFAKVGLEVTETSGEVRQATDDDVPGIVKLSARNRSILADLNEFWTPHANADARFANWMKRSLTLRDRDMLVSGSPGSLDGYVIAQPASRLHFPPGHDITGTGVIDDFFHLDYADPSQTLNSGQAATKLLRSAEAAFAARNIIASFVVCPAAWASKISILKDAGYETATVWMLKR